jgi:hypothetical protein
MKEEQKRSRFIKAILYIISFWPLLLSHHPECDKFNNHTLNFGKIRLCIGCFVGYPIAILGMFLIPILRIQQLIPYDYFLFISIILLATFIMSPLKLTKNKTIKIIQKALIGLGSSFLFWFIMTRPNPRIVNIFIFYFSFGAILAILNIYHVLGFVMTCYKCETPFLWGTCGGFNSIIKNFEKHELENFFISFEEFSESIRERRTKKN